MEDIVIGEKVINKSGETGTIVSFDGRFITVNFLSRVSVFQSDAFEKGFLSYVNVALQGKLDEAKQEEEQKATEKRLALERAVNERRQVQAELSKAHRRIAVLSATFRLDPAPITFTGIRKKDQDLIRQIFAECDKDIKELYNSVHTDMEYLNRTYHGRSKYCVGFLTKHFDTYVFRLFSRNDLYKKDAQEYITVTASDVTEVLRILQINGRVYYLSKNLTSAGGYLVNTKGNGNWHVSDLNNAIMVNQVIKNCNCGYLNNYIAAKNIDCLQYLNVLMPALHNSKAEIVLKHGLFKPAHRINDLAAYLEEFTPKQITVACENQALNALPFMRRFGNLEPEVLRNLDLLSRKRKDGQCIYSTLQMLLEQLGLTCTDLDKKVIGFLQKVDRFNPRIYNDYINLLADQPGVTLQDFFVKDYIDRHFILAEQSRGCYTAREAEEYRKVAEELSWIGREENDLFIIVPPNIADFRNEGAAQHNCVYTCKYYKLVIRRESIIVFLRKEKDTPFVTIEYDYETFEVLQAYGKYNREIPKDLYEYVKNLGERLHYEMRSHQ